MHGYNNLSQAYYIENHVVNSSPLIQLNNIIKIWYCPQLFWNKISISIVALSDTPFIKITFLQFQIKIIKHMSHTQNTWPLKIFS